MNDKKTLWVAEDGSHPKQDRKKFFIRSADIGKAHRKARELFGPGVSFTTREPNDTEKQIASAYTILEI